jgi:NAD(P)-dependent dehydrogenase (short-subunit alcohol dehydrogenase family)
MTWLPIECMSSYAQPDRVLDNGGSMSAGELAGRVAIVTGGASGLGVAYCRGLSEAGAKVVIADRDEVMLRRTTDKLNADGLEVVPIPTDVTNRVSTESMAETILGKWGRIDILVNNAAITTAAPFDEITEASWDSMYAVNVKGMWLTTLAVVPAMKSQGKGKIINIGSQTFFSGWPNYLHYVGTKGAVIGMTRALAIEVGPLGIRVNCLCPGLSMTEKALVDVEQSIMPGQVGRWVDDHVAGQCIKHPGYPEDLVGPLLYLASDASDFMTGQTMLIDGGWAKH